MIKEVEIYRMNFLRQHRGTFTYKTMMYVMIGWCLFLACLYGMQMMRQVMIKRGIEAAKLTIESLNKEKDKSIELIQSVSKTRSVASTKDDIYQIIAQRPAWSRVLDKAQSILPAQLWLQSLAIAQAGENLYMLTIKGKAKSQREITNFIMQLESGSFFARTSLVKTNQAEGKEVAIEYEIVTYPVLSKF